MDLWSLTTMGAMMSIFSGSREGRTQGPVHWLGLIGASGIQRRKDAQEFEVT